MKRLLNLFILVSFVANLALPYNANAQTLNLPVPTQILNVSQNYSFPVLRGLKLDPKNPLNIEFIIDPGTQKSVNKEEAGLLIKYFLAALTIPRENLWVNLSPYESNRIVPQALSQTELGEDMLGQDYLLKQLAASMTYPETEVGKKYWDEMNGVGARSPRPGRGNPAPTSVFNKVWITADKAQIYEGKNVALITKSSLKALTEEDYLAVQNNVGARSPRPEQPSKDALGGQGNPAPTEPFKRYILPSINKEINQGKNFAQLRQIYNAVILGLWFKNKFQESFYKNYFNKETVKGIDTADKAAKDKIYNLYVEAFKKGVYNYVKREYAGTGTGSPIRGSVYAPGRIIKRQYFSGGVTPAEGLAVEGAEITRDPAAETAIAGDSEVGVLVTVVPNGQTTQSRGSGSGTKLAQIALLGSLSLAGVAHGAPETTQGTNPPKTRPYISAAEEKNPQIRRMFESDIRALFAKARDTRLSSELRDDAVRGLFEYLSHKPVRDALFELARTTKDWRVAIRALTPWSFKYYNADDIITYFSDYLTRRWIFTSADGKSVDDSTYGMRIRIFNILCEFKADPRVWALIEEAFFDNGLQPYAVDFYVKHGGTLSAEVWNRFFAAYKSADADSRLKMFSVLVKNTDKAEVRSEIINVLGSNDLSLIKVAVAAIDDNWPEIDKAKAFNAIFNNPALISIMQLGNGEIYRSNWRNEASVDIIAQKVFLKMIEYKGLPAVAAIIAEVFGNSGINLKAMAFTVLDKKYWHRGNITKKHFDKAGLHASVWDNVSSQLVKHGLADRVSPDEIILRKNFSWDNTDGLFNTRIGDFIHIISVSDRRDAVAYAEEFVLGTWRNDHFISRDCAAGSLLTGDGVNTPIETARKILKANDFENFIRDVISSRQGKFYNYYFETFHNETWLGAMENLPLNVYEGVMSRDIDRVVGYGAAAIPTLLLFLQGADPIHSLNAPSISSVRSPDPFYAELIAIDALGRVGDAQVLPVLYMFAYGYGDKIDGHAAVKAQEAFESVCERHDLSPLAQRALIKARGYKTAAEIIIPLLAGLYGTGWLVKTVRTKNGRKRSYLREAGSAWFTYGHQKGWATWSKEQEEVIWRVHKKSSGWHALTDEEISFYKPQEGKVIDFNGRSLTIHKVHTGQWAVTNCKPQEIRGMYAYLERGGKFTHEQAKWLMDSGRLGEEDAGQGGSIRDTVGKEFQEAFAPTIKRFGYNGLRNIFKKAGRNAPQVMAALAAVQRMIHAEKDLARIGNYFVAIANRYQVIDETTEKGNVETWVTGEAQVGLQVLEKITQLGYSLNSEDELRRFVAQVWRDPVVASVEGEQVEIGSLEALPIAKHEETITPSIKSPDLRGPNILSGYFLSLSIFRLSNNLSDDKVRADLVQDIITSNGRVGVEMIVMMLTDIKANVVEGERTLYQHTRLSYAAAIFNEIAATDQNLAFIYYDTLTRISERFGYYTQEGDERKLPLSTNEQTASSSLAACKRVLDSVLVEIKSSGFAGLRGPWQLALRVAWSKAYDVENALTAEELDVLWHAHANIPYDNVVEKLSYVMRYAPRITSDQRKWLVQNKWLGKKDASLKPRGWVAGAKLSWYVSRLGSNDPVVCVKALKNLGELHDPAAVEPILGLLERDSGRETGQLGSSTVGEAIAVLEKFLPLSQYGERYLKLFTTNNDQDPFGHMKKRYTAIALSGLKVNNPPVVDWLSSEKSKKYEALAMGKDEFEETEQALKNLGATNPQLIKWYVGLLHESEVGAVAAQKLIALGDHSAGDLIIANDVCNTRHAYEVLAALRPSSDDAMVLYCLKNLIRYGDPVFVALTKKHKLDTRLLNALLLKPPFSSVGDGIQILPATLQSLGASYEQILKFYFTAVRYFTMDRYSSVAYDALIKFLGSYGDGRAISILENMLAGTSSEWQRSGRGEQATSDLRSAIAQVKARQVGDRRLQEAWGKNGWPVLSANQLCALSYVHREISAGWRALTVQEKEEYKASHAADIADGDKILIGERILTVHRVHTGELAVTNCIPGQINDMYDYLEKNKLFTHEQAGWLMDNGYAGEQDKGEGQIDGGLSLYQVKLEKFGDGNFYFERIPNVAEINSMGFVINEITPNKTIAQLLN